MFQQHIDARTSKPRTQPSATSKTPNVYKYNRNVYKRKHKRPVRASIVQPKNVRNVHTHPEHVMQYLPGGARSAATAAVPTAAARSAAMAAVLTAAARSAATAAVLGGGARVGNGGSVDGGGALGGNGGPLAGRWRCGGSQFGHGGAARGVFTAWRRGGAWQCGGGAHVRGRGERAPPVRLLPNTTPLLALLCVWPWRPGTSCEVYPNRRTPCFGALCSLRVPASAGAVWCSGALAERQTKAAS